MSSSFHEATTFEVSFSDNCESWQVPSEKAAVICQCEMNIGKGVGGDVYQVMMDCNPLNAAQWTVAFMCELQLDFMVWIICQEFNIPEFISNDKACHGENDSERAGHGCCFEGTNKARESD